MVTRLGPVRLSLVSMRFAAMYLRQRDGVTCGPAAAVLAGALLDPDYRSKLTGPSWFDTEQSRIHRTVNWLWPRRLGTTPMGIAGAVSVHSARYGVRYRWRLFGGLFGRRDRLSDVLRAVESDWPVAMLIGRFIPRHWVLIVAVSGDALQCYEPSSGEVRSVEVDAVRTARLSGLGFPRPFAFVLPGSSSRTRLATSGAESASPATTPARFRSVWF
jgi:hypothetical protein